MASVDSATYYQQLAEQAAIANGFDPKVFVAQINQESGFNPNARSPAGAIGIAQIMPDTAKGWGVDPTNPVDSLNAAAKAMGGYLQTYGGDYAKALAAYNAGPGAVAKYGGVPPFAETQNYVKTILDAAGVPSGINPQNIVSGIVSNITGAIGSGIKGAIGSGVPSNLLANGGLIVIGLVGIAIGGAWLIERSSETVAKSPIVKTAVKAGALAKLAG